RLRSVGGRCSPHHSLAACRVAARGLFPGAARVTGAFRRRCWAGLAFAASLTGCSEQLTQPGQCPELCPGGIPQGEEQVLTALHSQDSAFTGYPARSSGSLMLVGSGAPALADTSYGVIVFNPRADSVNFRDTLRAYTVDSARISLLTAHDTATRHVLVQLY